MPNNLPNQYSLGNLPGIEPKTRRVFQDLVDQLNYLTGEVTRLRERDLVVMPAGAARGEDPIEGLITIPYRDPGGRDGQIRVSKDGVIVSYVNPAESLFPYIDLRSVNSSGVGPDVLHTFSLPAGSLGKNGDYLKVWYAGIFASVNRDKFVQAQFDGQSYEPGGVFDFDGSTGWILFNRIVRIDATHVHISHQFLANLLSINSANTASSQNIGGLIITRNSASLTVSNLDITAVTMRVRSVVAAGAAAGDVVQNESIIELYRPRVTVFV